MAIFGRAFIYSILLVGNGILIGLYVSNAIGEFHLISILCLELKSFIPKVSPYDSTLMVHDKRCLSNDDCYPANVEITPLTIFKGECKPDRRQTQKTR